MTPPSEPTKEHLRLIGPDDEQATIPSDPDAEWTETRWRLEAAGLSPAEKEDILDEFHTLAREVRP